MWVELSKSEKKVESFAYEKFLDLKEDGSKLFWHSLEVARLLHQNGYRGKYVFTALCQYLPEQTETTEYELEKNCGRITAEAVGILSQKDLNKQDHADLIWKNEVACLVKIADLMVRMKKVMLGESGKASTLAKEIEKYHLGIADWTKFKDEFNDLFRKLKLCVMLDKMPNLDQIPAPEGWESDNGFDRFEIVIKHARLVEGLSQDASDIYMNGKRFVDMIREDERKQGWKKNMCGNYIGCPPRHVLLPENSAFLDPDNDPLRDVDDGRTYTLACNLCGESECSTVRVRITVDKKTVTWSEIGRKAPGEVGPFTFRRDQYEHALDHGNVAYLTAYCYANGLRGLKKNKSKMLSMLRLAILYENNQAEALSHGHDFHHQSAEDKKTTCWIKDSGTHFSALKAVFTPRDIKMIHFNTAHLQGVEVDDVSYYKIATGMDFDYDCVSEDEFNHFIQMKCIVNGKKENDEEKKSLLKYQKLIDYIPYFESARWNRGERYDSQFKTFLAEIEESEIQVSDYMNLVEQAGSFAEAMKKIDRADLTLVRALLTWLMRSERFCEGSWQTAVSNKSFLRILERLRALSESTSA